MVTNNLLSRRKDTQGDALKSIDECLTHLPFSIATTHVLLTTTGVDLKLEYIDNSQISENDFRQFYAGNLNQQMLEKLTGCLSNAGEKLK